MLNNNIINIMAVVEESQSLFAYGLGAMSLAGLPGSAPSRTTPPSPRSVYFEKGSVEPLQCQVFSAIPSIEAWPIYPQSRFLVIF